jgi:hypothetical protein
MDEFSKKEVPTYPGYLTGIRAYRMGHNGVLVSPQQPFTWEPGENQASCIHKGYQKPHYYYTSQGKMAVEYIPSEHDVATLGCSCGFYAYFEPLRAKTYLPRYPTNSVLAVVQGYGRVTMGESGMRAEKMKVVGLIPYVPERKDVPSEPQPPTSPRRLIWLSVVLLALMWLFIAAGIIWHSGWCTAVGYLFMLGVWVDTISYFWRSRRYRKALDTHLVEWTNWLNTSSTLAGAFKYCDPPEDAVQAFQRLYPDVKIYDSVTDALQDHPLSQYSDV